MRSDAQFPITRRETVAIALASDGLPVKRIAYEMAITTATVNHHLSNARLKLGASNVAHLVAIALRRGIVA